MPILHPQPFPGNWTRQPVILAPFWCLADNSYSKTLPEGIRSHVWHHSYERLVAADVPMLEAIDSLITAQQRRTERAFVFAASWALVVTWQRITPLPGIYKYQIVRSSALRMYICAAWSCYCFESHWTWTRACQNLIFPISDCECLCLLYWPVIDIPREKLACVGWSQCFSMRMRHNDHEDCQY